MMVRAIGMVALAAVLGAACSASEEAVVVQPGADDASIRDAGRATDAGPRVDRATTTDARPTTDAGDTGSTSSDAVSTSDATPTGDGAVPERCDNGLDDDGDGMVDEGCVCIPGSSQRCYPRASAEVGRGPCAQGTQGCEGEGEFGTWTECVGAVTPAAEVCGDGVDQDCTGAPDDGDACLCRPGATEPCYTGPRGTMAVGICRAGERTCDPTGRAWGTCLDEVLPRAEICSNRVDDDCDGVVDNGPSCACTAGATRSCYPGPSTEVNVGVCRAGTQRCNAGGTAWGACAGAVGPSSEVCGNMLDDDCDGRPDDGCPTMRVCNVTVNLSGDCLTTRCPADCPYPIGCMITMSGDDPRGCVASRSDNPVVYFQEGDACGAGRVTGTLRCSNIRGAALNATNCVINKPTRYYPADRSGCPDT
jgi:hypothetical protein